jgi:hypothetical protein
MKTRRIVGVMVKAVCLAVMLVFPSGSWARGEMAGSNSYRRVIDAQLQITGRVKYSMDGVELHGYKSFEDLIDPVNDSMATYSLKTAKSEDAVSWVLMLTGLTAEVVGVVDAVNRADAYGKTGITQDYTADWIIGGGGLLLNGLGQIFQGQAQVDKFNAVKRYNQVIRSEDKISFLYSPERKGLGLAFAGSF